MKEKSKKVITSIYIDGEVWNRFRLKALGKHLKASEVAERLFREYVDPPEPKSGKPTKGVVLEREDKSPGVEKPEKRKPRPTKRSLDTPVEEPAPKKKKSSSRFRGVEEKETPDPAADLDGARKHAEALKVDVEGLDDEDLLSAVLDAIMEDYDKNEENMCKKDFNAYKEKFQDQLNWYQSNKKFDEPPEEG